jgi:hypothetical protein
MTLGRWCTLAAIFVLSAGVALCAWLADRAERSLHVTLSCHGRSCQASIDGGKPLEIEVSTLAGAQIGVYAYHPFEFDQPQGLASLVLRRADVPDAEIRVRFAPGAWTPAGWHGDPGWSMTERGFSHTGSLGDRAIALFDGLDAREFTLDAAFVDSVDVGVVFRAQDAKNAWIFAVRARHNDAFFFRMEDGKTQAIVAMMPVRELHAAREGLRLAGVVAQILLLAIPLVLAVRAWLEWFATISPWSREVDSRTSAPRIGIVLLFAVTVAALSGIALYALGGVPHVDDEAAYLFQAKIFAHGDFWAPAPPEPEFFAHEHMIITPERWFAKYPPFFPALLSLGVRAGAPWLVNPVLGALVGLAAYRLGREIAGWRCGIGAWCLLLVSPFFVIMGGTLMSHVAAALFVTLFVWQLLRAVEHQDSRAAVFAGASLGLAILTRPYTAALAALAALVYGTVCLVRLPHRRAIVVLGTVAVLATLPFACAFVAWGPWVSGDHGLEVGLHEKYNSSDKLGFGADKGATWLRTWGSFGHTPAKALRSAWQHLEYTSRYLLGWPGRLSLVLVLAPFILGTAGRREWLLASVLLALALGHMAYWAAHHILYGARYWFEAVPGVMVLASLGLRSLVHDLAFDWRVPAWSRYAPAAVLASLVAWGSWVYLPARLQALPAYGGITADLMWQIDRIAPHQAVVFAETQGMMYDPGFFLNDPFLANGRIFARDLGPHDQDLLVRYPGYLAYRWSAGKLTPIERARPGHS